jgi:hypothetical protein
MLGVLGSLGRVLAPQLITLGARFLKSTPIGGTIKKVLNSDIGKFALNSAKDIFS